MTTAPAPGGADDKDRAELLRRWLVAFLLLVTIAPLLFVPFPPLTDLYGHLGRYAIQTGIDTNPTFQATFDYHWKLVGNLGVDLLVEPLGPIFGLERAVWLIVTFSQLLGAAAIVWISRELHGRVTPYAVLALPFLFGFPFQMGFVNFTLSMALALAVFAVWLRLRKHGRTGAAIALLGVAGLVVWLSHTFGWAYLGLLCGSCSLADAWRSGLRNTALVRRVLADCAILLIALVPMLAWRSATNADGTQFGPIENKLLWVISALRGSGPVGDIAPLGVIAIVLLGALVSRTTGKHSGLAIAALLSLIAYLALPLRVFGSFFADMRLMPYVFIAALLCLAPDRSHKRENALLMLVAIGMLVFRAGVVTVDYRDKHRQVDLAAVAIDAIPRGARVAAFSIEPCAMTWRTPALWHVDGLAIARRGAFTNGQWDYPGLGPLRVTLPGAKDFDRDPTQRVTMGACPASKRLTVAQALATMPRAAFTHVWISGPGSAAIAPPAGTQVLYRDAMGTVLRLTPQR